jgi:hypothetical protein
MGPRAVRFGKEKNLFSAGNRTIIHRVSSPCHTYKQSDIATDFILRGGNHTRFQLTDKQCNVTLPVQFPTLLVPKSASSSASNWINSSKFSLKKKLEFR